MVMDAVAAAKAEERVSSAGHVARHSGNSAPVEAEAVAMLCSAFRRPAR